MTLLATREAPAAPALRTVDLTGPPTRRWRPPAALGEHLPFALGAVVITALLFRTWIAGGLPGGIDSGFLYSVLPLFSTYGASLFTVWLPIPFGQVQQYSVYWLLAMVMSVTRGAVGTYDAMAITLCLATLAVVYGLTYWLVRSRVAACVAATAYGCSPFVVAQWLDGHLDVEVAIAVGPLAVWMALVVLRTGSKPAAVGLGLCASALFLLTTGESAYWLFPMATLCLAEVLVLGRARRRALRHALWGGAVAAGTFVVASAVQLVPLLAGAKAPFLDSAANYYIESLAVHAKYSLPFAQNVLGVPRETWLAPGVHLGATGFDSVLYVAVAAVVLVVAAGAVRSRHRTLAVVLLGTALAGWLLASGPYGIAGFAYRFAYEHVPYFRFLRVPNRWLMDADLCIAIAAGIGVVRLLEHRRTVPLRGVLARWSARCRAALGIGATALACGLLATVLAGGVLERGLPTTTVPTSYAAAYSSLRGVPGDWRILTTPFFQSWMALGGGRLGNYQSILSDLGDTSTYWTGHNVVGRGGWDPRAAQFAQYLYDLTAQGSNTHLAGLLGAATIKYVGLDPTDATEVVAGQNAFFAAQHDFALAVHDGPYRILENQLAQPIAYVTPTFCVVAGGMGVLGDLAQDPAFSFGTTGLVFADQAVATGGAGALGRLVAASRCVIEAPGGASEMAVLTSAVATTSLSSLASGADLRTQVAPALDVAADPSVAVAVPRGTSLTWRPTTPGGTMRIWVRGLLGPSAGVLAVRVDGRAAVRLDFARPADLGDGWVASPPITLPSGVHTVRLTAVGAGLDQVVEAAVTRGEATSWTPPTKSVHVVRDVNFLDASLYATSARTTPLAAQPWTSIGATVRSSAPGVLVLPSAPGERSYYTLAEAPVDRPIDPNLPFEVDLWGSGSGDALYLNVYFDHSLRPTVSFRFDDTTTRERRLFFSPQYPTSAGALPDWRHVTAISLSTNSKSQRVGPLRLQGPFLFASANSLGLKGALPSAPDAPTRARSLADDQRVGLSATLHDVPAGLLVFTQSYAAAWHLRGAVTTAHTVGLGFANAYVITAPSRTATLGYATAALGRASSAVSLVGWMGGLTLISVWSRSSRRRRRHRRRGTPEVAR